MTFDFTMDVMPGYTLFDNTHKVMCVFQILTDSTGKDSEDTVSVMKHNAGITIGSSMNDGNALNNDSIEGSGESTNDWNA